MSWWTENRSREAFEAEVASRQQSFRSSKFGTPNPYPNTILATDEAWLRAALRARRSLETMTCSSLDHQYPLNVVAGQPCFCGKRTFGETGPVRNKRKKVVAPEPTIAVESEPTEATTPPEPTEATTPPVKGRAPMQFKLLKTRTNGGALYAVDGLRGSIRLPKSLFAGAPPEVLEVSAEGLAEPNAEKLAKQQELAATRDQRKADAEARKAVKAATAQSRADVAAAKLAKAQEIARKAQERLAKFAPVTPVEPTEPVEASV